MDKFRFLRKNRKVLSLFLLFFVIVAELHSQHASFEIFADTAPLQEKTYQSRMFYAVHHDILVSGIQSRKQTASFCSLTKSRFSVEKNTQRFLFFLQPLVILARAFDSYRQEFLNSFGEFFNAGIIIRYIHNQDGEKDNLSFLKI